jgi:hypothetical protein
MEGEEIPHELAMYVSTAAEDTRMSADAVLSGVSNGRRISRMNAEEPVHVSNGQEQTREQRREAYGRARRRRKTGA